MSRVRGAAMLGTMMTYYRAWENRRFVRSLLREKQPEFAAVLESAVREAPCLRCPARSRPPTAALADSVNGPLYPIFAVGRPNH
jgi:hypothetical protein